MSTIAFSFFVDNNEQIMFVKRKLSLWIIDRIKRNVDVCSVDLHCKGMKCQG